MGGKNPAIVMPSADLDEAAEGVMRSAFGFDGQKCSANSRVYVHRDVADEFVDKLVEKTRGIRTGDPTERDNWMGPVINQRALDTFSTAVAEAKADGGTIEIGGEADGSTGYFPTPTVVSGLPLEHRLFHDELFVPFLVVGEVDSLDEALERANATAVRPDRRHLQPRRRRGAHASSIGSRRASSTSTGGPVPRPAPGRASRASAAGRARGRPGKSGLGPYYVQQFLREQSQTVVGG